MSRYTDHQWEEAETEVRKKAEELAYKCSEGSKDRDSQRMMYDLVKDCVMFGARKMQEELSKFD